MSDRDDKHLTDAVAGSADEQPEPGTEHGETAFAERQRRRTEAIRAGLRSTTAPTIIRR